MSTCIICDSDSFRTGKRFYDDRYGYPGEFGLMACSVCGHKYLDHNFTPEALKDIYTSYYPRSSFSLEQFRTRKEAKGFSAWLNGSRRSAYCWVPPKVRVLDIGCGFGESLAYHAARGCDAYGVEVDENIKRVAEKFGFKVHVGPFAPNVYSPDFFDYVTMDQVLEHVVDPVETLLGVEQILRPGGKVIISTPNANGWGAHFFGRRWINWHAPYHLHHFSVQSMGFAAEKAGLAVEQVRTITMSEWLLYQWIHVVLFPKPGEPSVFWALERSKADLDKIWIKAMTLIHHLKINHLITRMFDQLGVGDNRLFVLIKK